MTTAISIKVCNGWKIITTAIPEQQRQRINHPTISIPRVVAAACKVRRLAGTHGKLLENENRPDVYSEGHRGCILVDPICW